MEFYHTGDALISARQFIRDSSDEGVSWAGTVVYYDFVVDNEGRRSELPIVSYCTDITDLRDKNLETGELLPDNEEAQNIVAEQIVVEENELGVWQAVRVLPDDAELDRECER